MTLPTTNANNIALPREQMLKLKKHKTDNYKVKTDLLKTFTQNQSLRNIQSHQKYCKPNNCQSTCPKLKLNIALFTCRVAFSNAFLDFVSLWSCL